MESANAVKSIHHGMENLRFPEHVFSIVKDTQVSPYDILISYRPYMLRLVKKKEDAEDLEQEVNIKFITLFGNNAQWWEEVKSKRSYVFMMITHTAIDVIRRNQRVVIEEPQEQLDEKSDEGNFVAGLNDKIDRDKFHLQLLDLLKNLSAYEQKLVWMTFFEGCKPGQVAYILRETYPDKDPKAIAWDCNAAQAKFRARLKKLLKNIKRTQ